MIKKPEESGRYTNEKGQNFIQYSDGTSETSDTPKEYYSKEKKVIPQQGMAKNNKSKVMDTLKRFVPASKATYIKSEKPLKSVNFTPTTFKKPLQIQALKTRMRQYGDKGYKPSNGIKVGP